MKTSPGLVFSEEPRSFLFLLTAVHQDVSLQAAFMRRDVAAPRAAVDLLVGVQTHNVLLVLHGVKGHKGAKVTAELLLAGVAESPVLQEDVLIGAGEAAV